MTATKRRFLGRYNSLVTRQVVYATDAAIEIDEHEGFEIRRKRVFYEDVLMVTMHERTSIFGAFFGLGLSFFIFIMGALLASTVGWKVVVFAIPFLFLGIAFLVVKESVITVFGQRSKARIRIPFRKKRARRIYDEICANVRRAQAQMAEEVQSHDLDQDGSVQRS